jgi:FkbM family methyltransferase
MVLSLKVSSYPEQALTSTKLSHADVRAFSPTNVGPQATPKIVYDFGMNNGDDVAYYLRKGLRVVGVEANPVLCDLCAARFSDAIASAKLTILNVALVRETSEEQIEFFVHKFNHVLSQVGAPPDKIKGDFDAIRVPNRRASDVIKQFGIPHYVKIDIEHFDHIVLEDIFENGVRPPYISVESHSIQVFALLVAAGYRKFNLVDGITVSMSYGDAKINTPQGIESYSFKYHSAGPFGEDIVSPWLDQDSFFYFLASVGLGWKDIHATLNDVAVERYRPPPPPQPKSSLFQRVNARFRRAIAKSVA